MSRRGGAGEGVLLGLLLSVPVVAIPLFQIPMMFWARWSFYQRHPDYVQHSAPTISRAISDPAIGGPFAMMILAVTVVILLALVPIFHGYRLAIETRFAQEPALRRSLTARVWLAIGLQVMGSAGMVVCTQYTFANNHDLHMLGSYVFFVGQAGAIATSGFLCARIASAAHIAPDAPFALLPHMSRVRKRAAQVVAGMAALYMVLFAIKGIELPVPEYTIYYVYTVQEILTISSFIIYLALFAPDIFAIGRSLHALRVSPQAAGR
ncbi:Frag1/DRAM/Sfk1 family protein [Stappia stellulata]|uniref:Frag1/DRAM/Sfk1 family protein n=1 Tax=Stappia stellulata TaxID=71235 RepID=UPI001CD678DE|nr:Frag1/DRAM/Sfk1 family protein [Stappia stellulata]MCA1241577.1 Frag1/DRAM/Sfk1 family protein [Stappia stellulata]